MLQPVIGLMGEHDREDLEIKVEGIEGYAFRSVHIDVNGKWGGHRAMVAHFSPNDDLESIVAQRIYLYILVGDYWKIGRWPDDDPDVPTHWEVAKLLTQALQDGVDRNVLFKAIEQVITKAGED
jgi:hypothetical protein